MKLGEIEEQRGIGTPMVEDFLAFSSPGRSTRSLGDLRNASDRLLPDGAGVRDTVCDAIRLKRPRSRRCDRRSREQIIEEPEMQPCAELPGIGELPGTNVEGMEGFTADDFAYADPVDGSVAQNQGLRVVFTAGSRFVIRLSGTGTEGATLRLYLECYVAGPGGLDLDTQEALARVIAAAESLAGIEAASGRDGPNVVT